jgi:hypothetical protein
MTTTKCELLSVVQRSITRTRENGRKSVSMDVDEFLHAMQLDQRGGIDELETTLDELSHASSCKWTKMSENHREVVTFIL